MSVSVVLDHAHLSSLAQRICQARKLHGSDSPYVLGLFAAFEWLVVGSEGGEGLRRQLSERVLELESGQPSKAPETENTPVAAGESLLENNWIKGKVKWFNNDKGYGFISTDSNTDVFVHWRDISSWDRSLAPGDEVEFMVTKTAKGFQAINVMKSGKETVSGEDPPGNTEAETVEQAPESTPAPAESEAATEPVAPPGDQLSSA